MSAYLGKSGALYPVPCLSQEAIPQERPASFATTLGGRRIATLGAAMRRAWDVSIGTERPAGIGTLQTVLRSLPMPYVWYSDWACATNILTPAQAAFDQAWSAGGTVGPIVELDGGGYAVSLLESTGTGRTFVAGVPVPVGAPVTASVYARAANGSASSSLTMTFADAAGATVSTKTGVARAIGAGSGPLQRLTVSGTVPAGAATVRVNAANTNLLAAPAITLTTQALEWSHGNGCTAAVIAGADVAPIIAWGQPGGQRAGLSFTVTEVG